MKILVVGGAGYVGSRLVPHLIDRGYEVDVVDLLWFGNTLPKNVKVTQKSVFDITADELKPYDQVIFLAGLSNDPMAEYSPARNFVENGSAPSYLAYTAKLAGVKRLIYGGSCSVYGYTVNELYNEESPTISMYPYAISKLQGERGCYQLHDENFSVICFRKGTISGYSPRMRFDLIVNTMFKCALKDGVITVNNPSIWRPILSMEDAIYAYTRAVEAPPEISGIFNIASGNYTVGEVADLVRDGLMELMGHKAKIHIKNIRDYRNYKVSFERARNILSFKPRHDVKNIIKELVEHKDEWKTFDEDRFYNIKVFKKISPEQIRQLREIGG